MWIQSYVEKHERVPDWWRDFRSIQHSKEEHCSDAQVKELAHQQATAFRLPAALNGKTRWLDHSAPAWVCWGKTTTFPQRHSKEPETTKWCIEKKWWHWPWPLKMHRPFQNAPGCSLEGQSTGPQNVGCGKEGPYSSSWPYGGLITRTQSGRTNLHIWPWQNACFRAQGGCSLRIGPCAEEKSTSTSWVYPFMGIWVWPTPSRGCGLAGEHTSGSPIGSYLHGVPACYHPSLPSDVRLYFSTCF